MDELGQLILGERPTSREPDRSNVFTLQNMFDAGKKKSSMSGLNQQLQAQPEGPDELGALILGGNSLQKDQPQEPNALQRFGQGAAALADTTIGGVLPLVGHVAQAAVRPVTTPQKAEEFGQQLSSFFAQPFGKAFGVTETPGYKGEATQQLMGLIGEVTEKGADWVSKRYGIPIEDVRNMANSLALGGGAMAAKPLGAIGRAAGEKAFALEEKLPKVRVEAGKEQLQAQMNKQFQPAGAAATGVEAELRSELANAKPEIQQKFANARPEDFTPENLKVVKNHNQFAKFDMTPTEGQALENAQLMSDEYNSRVSDPNIRQAYEQRDQKLIQGFDKIRQEVAPDVFDTDPVKLANGALEKMKSDYEARQAEVRDAWKVANESTGTGEAPIDVGNLAQNIETSLKKAGKSKYVPAELKSDLEEALQKGYLTPEEYENFRTDTATIARTNQNPLARQAASIIRQQLENVELKDEFAQSKPLFDRARELTKELKKKEEQPFYSAAIHDTRTPEQIAQGVPHPAANTFLDKHYGAKTPEVQIRNLLDTIGENSPEHQALNAALIDKFKKGSGIVDDKGIVKQAALNKQIHELYKSNKGVMFGNKAVLDLEDLADVARKTEPTTGRHSVNTSNTAVVQEQGAMQAAAEAAKSFAAGSLEHGVNVAAKGVPVGTLIREAFKGKKAKELAEAEAKAAEELSKRRLSPTAGIKISDINQKPYRIELTGMAKKEK